MSIIGVGRDVALASNALLSGRSVRIAKTFRTSKSVDSSATDTLRRFGTLLAQAAKAAQDRADGKYTPSDPSMLTTIRAGRDVARSWKNGKADAGTYKGLAEFFKRTSELCMMAAGGSAPEEDLEELRENLVLVDSAFGHAVSLASRPSRLL